MVNMEVCANSVESALAAEQGGAIRVELCDNLAEGGTTPSYAQIKLAVEKLSISVYPIIRPRGGDFLYSDLEFELMKEDIMVCKQLGCDGVVFGILMKDGNVDVERCKELMAIAAPLKATFHRAFDMCRDMFTALEEIISMGFERILTSGGEASALKGASTISELVAKADGRIIIMPGAGINLQNIAELIAATGAKEFHGSAKTVLGSEMAFRNPRLNMGSVADEFSRDITDAKTVTNLLELANSSE